MTHPWDHSEIARVAQVADQSLDIADRLDQHLVDARITVETNEGWIRELFDRQRCIQRRLDALKQGLPDTQHQIHAHASSADYVPGYRADSDATSDSRLLRIVGAPITTP